jgi:hypothetical protein
VSCLCCLSLPSVVYERVRVLFVLLLSLPSVVYERVRVLFVLFVFAFCCL